MTNVAEGLNLFILRERERVSEHKQERGRERGRENPKLVLHCQHEPSVELDLTNREIMT